MDSSRFDALSRRVAQSANRRTLLKGILGIGAGAATGWASIDDADAVSCRAGAQSCTRSNQCCSGTCHDARHPDRSMRSRCECEGGDTLCGGKCTPLLLDPNNCGACGNVCASGVCVDGLCYCGLQPLISRGNEFEQIDANHVAVSFNWVVFNGTPFGQIRIEYPGQSFEATADANGETLGSFRVTVPCPNGIFTYFATDLTTGCLSSVFEDDICTRVEV